MAKGPKPKPPEVRWWAKVDKNGPVPEHHPDLGPCWLWTGAKGGTNGVYGRFTVVTTHGATRGEYAHRYSFVMANGPIPEGLIINHRCEVKRCVNPDHLEAVTYRENTRYGTSPVAQKARRTHCIHGHPLDKLKPNGTRRCTICPRLRMRAKRAA